MSDYKVIIEQFNNLWKLRTIPLIRDYKCPTIGNDYIGELSGKFTYKNYYEVYNNCLKNQNYQILMQDESMISMYYSFDNKGEINRYNLSFIPSLNSEVTKYSCEIHNIIEDVENYLRIDFDGQGYKKILHEKQHLHLGLNVNSKSHNRNLIRLPIAEKFYPWDFIFLVLKLIYHMEESDEKCFKTYNQNHYEIINVEEQIFHLKFNRM